MESQAEVANRRASRAAADAAARPPRRWVRGRHARLETEEEGRAAIVAVIVEVIGGGGNGHLSTKRKGYIF